MPKSRKSSSSRSKRKQKFYDKPDEHSEGKGASAAEVGQGSRNLVRERMGLDQTPDERKRMSKYEIVPISDKSSAEVMKRQMQEPFDDIFPAVIVLLGPVKSGKTVLLINMLLREELMGGLFDRLLICSPTVDLDQSWSLLVNVEGIEFYKSATTRLLDGLETKQIDYQNTHKGERLHQGIVIDDAVLMGQKSPNLKSMVAAFSSAYRHYCDMVILSTQSVRVVLNPVFRGNVGGWIVMHQTTLSERMKLWNELHAEFDLPTPKAMDQLFTENIKDKYGFMFINNRTKRIYNSFLNCIHMLQSPQEKEV